MNFFKDIIISNDEKITKQKLKESILSKGKKINNDILYMLLIKQQPVMIALAGWTNVRSNKVCPAQRDGKAKRISSPL
jgi:hypothetical protein